MYLLSFQFSLLCLSSCLLSVDFPLLAFLWLPNPSSSVYSASQGYEISQTLATLCNWYQSILKRNEKKVNIGFLCQTELSISL